MNQTIQSDETIQMQRAIAAVRSERRRFRVGIATLLAIPVLLVAIAVATPTPDPAPSAGRLVALQDGAWTAVG